MNDVNPQKQGEAEFPDFPGFAEEADRGRGPDVFDDVPGEDIIVEPKAPGVNTIGAEGPRVSGLRVEDAYREGVFNGVLAEVLVIDQQRESQHNDISQEDEEVIARVARGRADAISAAVSDRVSKIRRENGYRSLHDEVAIARGMVEGYRRLSELGLQFLIPSNINRDHKGGNRVTFPVSGQISSLLRGMNGYELAFEIGESGSYLSGNGLDTYPGQLLSISVLQRTIPDGAQFVAPGGLYGDAWQITVPASRERPKAPGRWGSGVASDG